MKNIKQLNNISIRYAKKYTFILLFILGLYSCNKQNPRKVLSNDKTAPGTVTNVKVKNLNGAAKISYDIPNDLDLLYVRAEYEIRPGVKEVTLASYYNDYVIVEGFGKSKSYTVTLEAVDRSNNRSKPVDVLIHPLISPVQNSYQTLTYEADFGGIQVSFTNETEADLVTTVLIKDSTNEWVVYDKNYSSLADNNFSVRNLPSEPTTFGVYIQDRWNNFSDTLIKNITPYFETKLDKTKFSSIEFPNDAENAWNTYRLWDNNTSEVGGGNGFSSKGGFPASFTVDLGVKTKISRFRIWQVHDGRAYTSGNIKTFQIWGSNDPTPDGSWDNSWTLLRDAEVVKPSGLPVGELSNEDKQTAAAGNEFSIPVDAPAVRYIRFKVLSTFASPPGSATGSFWMLELTFWGQIR